MFQVPTYNPSNKKSRTNTISSSLFYYIQPVVVFDCLFEGILTVE